MNIRGVKGLNQHTRVLVELKFILKKHLVLSNSCNFEHVKVSSQFLLYLHIT